MHFRTVFRILFLSLFLIPFVSLQAETAIVTTADGDGGDVYIKPGQVGDPFRLEVKNNATSSGPGVTTKSYLKFDLTGYADRMAGLESVVLHLVTNFNHIGGSTGDPADSTVYVFGMTDDSLDGWDETAVVWENAPANDVTSNDLQADKVISLGSFYVPANPDPDPVSFTSQELLDFIKADGNGIITLIMRREDSNGSHNLRFSSKEDAANRGNLDLAPTLELELPPDPNQVQSFDEILGAWSIRPG